MKEKEKRVLVGMSGGIDSSAACIMLQEQGYEVVGVTMRTWDVASHFTPGNDQPNEVIEAQELAARLGIEHHVADVRTEFRQVIVQYFIDEYMRGRTPNPCVMCNPLFKERILCEWADKCNCAWIATGHYCQLTVLLLVETSTRNSETHDVSSGRNDQSQRARLFGIQRF